MSELLFVSHVVPHPPAAGNELRIAKLIAWLRSQGHRVTYLLNGSLDGEARTALATVVDRVLVADELAAPEPDRLAQLAERAHALSRRVAACIPPGAVRQAVDRTLRGFDVARMLARPALVAATRIVCERHPIDAVIAEYVFAAPCLRAAPRALKLIDTHDVFSRRKQEVIRHGIDDPHHLPRWRERRYLLQADVVIAIQEEEAQLLAALVPEREVITVGVDFPIAPRDARAVVPGRILIVGSDNPLNVHGATEFRKHAWPAIRDAVPDAVVRVVGKLAERLAPGDERFQLVGFRADLGDEWAAASLVLNPTVAGTGLKIKSVEALARGKALVATRNAVEGIATGPAPPFRACGDFAELARATIALLGAPEERRALEERARAWAERHLTVEEVYRPLADVLRRRLS